MTVIELGGFHGLRARGSLAFLSEHMQAELCRPAPQDGRPVTQDDGEVSYVYVDLADLRGELPPPGSQITLQASIQRTAACDGMRNLVCRPTTYSAEPGHRAAHHGAA